MTTHAAPLDELLPWGDPAFNLSPYPWYDRLRQEHPVYEARDGIFVVTRYDDIVNFGRSPHITILNPEDTAFSDGFAHTVLGYEPPVHTKKRAAFNPWLTPKACKEYVKAGVAALNAELDKYADGEVIDAHHRLGIIPTHAVMCAMLNVPTTNPNPEPAVLAMLDVMRGASATKTASDEQAAEAGFAYLQDRVGELVKIKQDDPGDGLADALIGLERDGAISTDEMRQTLSLFWGSGAHNPSYMMAAAIEFFANNPEIYEIFRSQPDKRRAILSEILRLYPAELAMVRYAVEDFEIGDVRIPKGSQIRFMLNAANRDPEAFPNPNACVLDRPLRPSHLTFGVGHHGCAGAVLAYMEGEALLSALAERVERIEMAGESTFDAHDRACAYLTQAVRLKMVS